MAESTDEIARAWLAEMEQCVRAEDYARARAIFAPDVVAFGTRGVRLVGREAVERDQWRRVWGAIRAFTFLTDELSCGGDDGLVWLATRWTSQGQDAAGRPFDRPGRMTAVLARRDDRWLAVHTHFSLNPV